MSIMISDYRGRRVLASHCTQEYHYTVLCNLTDGEPKKKKKERRNTWGAFSYFYLHCYVCLISVTYILYIETCLCVQYSITENLRQMQMTFCSILVILITNKKAHRHDTNTLADTDFYNTIVGGKRSVKMRRMILQDFLSVSKQSLETKRTFIWNLVDS